MFGREEPEGGKRSGVIPYGDPITPTRFSNPSSSTPLFPQSRPAPLSGCGPIYFQRSPRSRPRRGPGRINGVKPSPSQSSSWAEVTQPPLIRIGGQSKNKRLDLQGKPRVSNDCQFAGLSGTLRGPLPLRRPSEIHNPLFPLNTWLRSFRPRPLMCKIWTFR